MRKTAKQKPEKQKSGERGKKGDSKQRTLTFVPLVSEDDSNTDPPNHAIQALTKTRDDRTTESSEVSYISSEIQANLVATHSSKIRKRKYIQCCLYGQIRFPPLLVAFIDTPQFQRLRRLKQLGILESVYPAATHSRFEHSLGVCHRAGELVRRIQEEQDGLLVTERDRLCVMLAGLCHDLGHGPFSHQFELVAHRLALQHPPGSSERSELATWRHEEMSVRMFRHAIRANGIDVSVEAYGGLTEQDLLFVEEMIDGRRERRGRGPGQAFLYDVVNNIHSGLDVDKLDYLVLGHVP
jgi:hypothetical protein